MIGLVGLLAVVTGAVSAAVLTIQGIRAASGSSASLAVPARTLLWSGIVAMGALESAILFNDFTVSYVANHHSVTTPFPFNLASGWAALEGSIVLWGLVLVIFTWITYRHYRARPDPLGAGTLAVMGIVALFFFGVMSTIANPFETCVEAAARSCITSSPIPFIGAEAPADGFGPNALLQNHILMAIHPPMLYVGFIGLTVPFAYAIAALALALPGDEWLRRSRRSTLTAWIFLTAGIVLGSWWAYEVLSWGGWWAWDPVENASFIPWLVATAFLHSSLVQTRRGMLQAWNFVLVISAFALTILGTFLTRSGTIVSVHSFTQSAIGPALLAFLVAILVGSFGLFAWRANVVAQPSRMDNPMSREGAMLFNNLLLAVYALVVLVGTTYPILLEAFSGDTVQVGAPFFNRFAAPLSLALLLVMGIGPVLPWRHARPELVWRRIHTPLQVALAAGLIVAIAVSRTAWVVLVLVLGVFMVSVGVRHAWVQASVTARSRHTSAAYELVRLFKRDGGYWGGQVSHIGVAVVAVGIALATNLSLHTQATLAPEEAIEFAGYRITYVGPFTQRQPNRLVVGARLSVARDDRIIRELSPRLNEFANSSQAIGTPAIYSSLWGDLYVSLRRVDQNGITIALDSSPGQWYLWLGGMVVALGGAISLRYRHVDKGGSVG